MERKRDKGREPPIGRSPKQLPQGRHRVTVGLAIGVVGAHLIEGGSKRILLPSPQLVKLNVLPTLDEYEHLIVNAARIISGLVNGIRPDAAVQLREEGTGASRSHDHSCSDRLD
jgi:hypothetical protein